MTLDLSWLRGRRLIAVEKKDITWFFKFDDASSILTESFWRLLTDKVLRTSEDHGQLFGLKEPVDAAKAVEEALQQEQVAEFTLDERTGDLSLDFAGGKTIQFVTTSGGYEGWRIEHGDQSVICLGGGELAIFGPT
jgi:hypothetical protein